MAACLTHISECYTDKIALLHYSQSIDSHRYTEASQLICTTNQLTVFYTSAALAWYGLRASTVGEKRPWILVFIEDTKLDFVLDIVYLCVCRLKLKEIKKYLLWLR